MSNTILGFFIIIIVYCAPKPYSNYWDPYISAKAGTHTHTDNISVCVYIYIYIYVWLQCIAERLNSSSVAKPGCLGDLRGSTKYGVCSHVHISGAGFHPPLFVSASAGPCMVQSSFIS